MQNTPNIYPLLWMEGKTEQWMTKYHEKITIVSHRCQIVRSVTYIAIIRLVFTVSHRNGCRTLSYFFTNKPNFHILVSLCMDNVNHPNRHTCRMVMKSSKQEFSHKTKWDRIARDLTIVSYIQSTDTSSIFGPEIHSVFEIYTYVILKMKCAICCCKGDESFFLFFYIFILYIFWKLWFIIHPLGMFIFFTKKGLFNFNLPLNLIYIMICNYIYCPWALQLIGMQSIIHIKLYTNLQFGVGD